MTENCLDLGTIQAFLDGEIASGKSEAIARHVSVCDDCANMLAEAEEESAFAFSALEQEFNTLVPTQRLWTKINDSIEKERKSFWKPLFAFLLQPSTMAFASLIFVTLVSTTLFSLKPDEAVKYVARNEPKTTVNVPIAVPTSTKEPSISEPEINNEPIVAPTRRNVRLASDIQPKNEIRAVKAGFAGSERNTEDVKPKIKSETVIPALSENIGGEENYLKTIATLTQTVNDRKDQTLSASARFAFERDLAVTEDAIKQMKREVRKNPKNDAAKQILRASYQNKIDLLNSVADKTELMASLK